MRGEFVNRKGLRFAGARAKTAYLEHKKLFRRAEISAWSLFHLYRKRQIQICFTNTRLRRCGFQIWLMF